MKWWLHWNSVYRNKGVRKKCIWCRKLYWHLCVTLYTVGLHQVVCSQLLTGLLPVTSVYTVLQVEGLLSVTISWRRGGESIYFSFLWKVWRYRMSIKSFPDYLSPSLTPFWHSRLCNCNMAINISSSSVIYQTTGPKPLPKRFLHIVRSRASSFNWQYPLLSLRSSSSFLRLLPRLLVTSICPFIFPSITCCRRQFLRKMWPIQLAFRFFISCRIFLCSLTLSNTSSFLTWSVRLIFSILLQDTEI